jgi:hypothetical protein
LGARTVGAADLLSDPALRQQIEQASIEQSDDREDLADAVLRLAESAAQQALPVWLGELELPDSEGDWRPADELLLSDAPLAAVLVADSPFGTVDSEFARAYGAEALRAVGVGWGFAVLTEHDPIEPDHDLDDEIDWWNSLTEPPSRLIAVRDLDLVDADRWGPALHLLVSDPVIAPLLADRGGYTAWWLRRHARFDGVAPGALRRADDDALAEVLMALDHPGARRCPAIFADSAALDEQAVAAILDSLADAGHEITPQCCISAYRLLTSTGRAAVAAPSLPATVRASSGDVVDVDRVMVLDLPWYAFAIPPDRLVVGDIRHAGRLAELLDLPLASQCVTAEVIGSGRRVSAAQQPYAAVLCAAFGFDWPTGEVVIHDAVHIRLDGSLQATATVPWWVDGQTVHLTAQG